MVPWTYVDRVGFTGFNRQPMGTGPLRFVSWTKGDQCVLEANPDYWGGRLDLDRVIFRPVPDPAARVDALLRGDADLITQLSPPHGERVTAHPSTRIVGAPYAGLYVLAVNALAAPLNQPLVNLLPDRRPRRIAVGAERRHPVDVAPIWFGRRRHPRGCASVHAGPTAPDRGARARLRRGEGRVGR
jgi:ABC-type transport system substrate-binding protein